MSYVFIPIGLFIGVALVTRIGAAFILWIHAPEPGSNDDLRQWILEHGNLDSYPL